MQTKCGNLIPLPEIPLYINSDHVNVLLFSLNEKKKTKHNQTPLLVLVRASTGDLSSETESKKKITSLAYLHPSELSAVWQAPFCPFPVLHKPCQPCYS